MKVIRLLCSPRNHRDRSRYGSIPGKGEGMPEPLRRAVADYLGILQGFPHRVNRTSSRESAPDPQLRNLLTRAGHVWGDEKLGLPLVSMIGNGLAMGQNYYRARCENRKPAGP